MRAPESRQSYPPAQPGPRTSVGALSCGEARAALLCDESGAEPTSDSSLECPAWPAYQGAQPSSLVRAESTTRAPLLASWEGQSALPDRWLHCCNVAPYEQTCADCRIQLPVHQCRSEARVRGRLAGEPRISMDVVTACC
jgi:hypothetical protein